MDKLKQYVALTVVGVLAVAAAGWFLLISPKRGEAADVRDQAATQVTANATLQTRIQMLKAQAKQLPQQQAKLAKVAAKIPDNPALPALIRGLTDAADASGVELVSLAPTAPAPVAAPAAAKPVAAAGTPAAGAAADPLQKPAAASTLQAIGLTINVVGGYFQIEQFLDRTENLTRALKVSGLSMGPGANPVKPAPAGAAPTLDDGRSLSANITASVYMATSRTAAASSTTAGK